MFRYINSLSFFCFLFLASLFVYCFAWVTPRDVDAYHLLEEKRKHISQSAFFSTTQQNRKGVTKDIYLTEDQGRVEYRIESVSSFLTLVPRASHFDLYEKLENIDCWIQDKLYQDMSTGKPMQQIKHVKAKEGTYRYREQRFVADSVDLSLYRTSGHLLKILSDERPFMKGVAGSVSFAVSGKNPELHAQHFTALLGGSQGD